MDKYCKNKFTEIICDRDDIKELQDKLKNIDVDISVSTGKGYVFEDRFIDITNLCETSSKELVQNFSSSQLISHRQDIENYTKRNTIYILTTPNMKKDRRYIIKKSKNPTKILEYEEVIYFHDCLDEEKMNISKIIIFNKLKRYREHLDKEIFILPEGRDIEYFKDLIKKVIEFVIIKSLKYSVNATLENSTAKRF